MNPPPRGNRLLVSYSSPTRLHVDALVAVPIAHVPPRGQLRGPCAAPQQNPQEHAWQGRGARERVRRQPRRVWRKTRNGGHATRTHDPPTRRHICALRLRGRPAPRGLRPAGTDAPCGAAGRDGGGGAPGARGCESGRGRARVAGGTIASCVVARETGSRSGAVPRALAASGPRRTPAPRTGPGAIGCRLFGVGAFWFGCSQWLQ